jgi:hypothetical protein
MEKISNSFALVRASANVVMADKELLVFPLLSGLATVLVAATFVAPIFLTGGSDLFAADGNLGVLGTATMFGFYVVQYGVIFFFNAALVGAALIRLDGGDPSIGDGLAIASKRMGSILGYAVIAATVGMILRAISERGGIIGRIAAGLVGLSWTFASYLTVPVLVTKDIGPIDAVKESAMIFKRTWGEQVVGNFGVGAAVTVLMLGWMGLGFLVVYMAAQISAAAVAPMILIMVLGAVLIGLFGSTLNGVYTAALYRYAMTGEVLDFDARMMGNAFRPK